MCYQQENSDNIRCFCRQYSRSLHETVLSCKAVEIPETVVRMICILLTRTSDCCCVSLYTVQQSWSCCYATDDEFTCFYVHDTPVLQNILLVVMVDGHYWYRGVPHCCWMLLWIWLYLLWCIVV